MATATTHSNDTLQFATFYLGDLLLGIDIQQVQEINRVLEFTRIPHAASAVRGVINLRGEVVTVVDLRLALRLPKASVTRRTRNVIVNSGEEAIGLIVDQIADVITARADEIDPRPENISGIDNTFFRGVYKLSHGLLVILNVDDILSAIIAERSNA